MNDEILKYYEEELIYIRKMGELYAKKHKKIAGKLALEPGRCEDPHVERLIEAFAFLCGRIHKKIDDDYPEIIDSLLNIIYPDYNRPIPSMTIVMFDSLSKLEEIPDAGYEIEKETTLYSDPVDDEPLKFKTCYPVKLWPIKVSESKLIKPGEMYSDDQEAILIQLKTSANKPFSKIKCEKLRFFLNGQEHLIYKLYELILNKTNKIKYIFSNEDGELKSKEGRIEAVGFSDNENLLPESRRSFSGFRLIFEYFCFPEKFLFFDLCDLDDTFKSCNSDHINVLLYLNTYDNNLAIENKTFCLYATPAINLYKRKSNPINIQNKKIKYLLIPDIRRRDRNEVFSIDKVTASTPNPYIKNRIYLPFYSLKHYQEDEDIQTVYWTMHRVPSYKKDVNGTDVYLSFNNQNIEIEKYEEETLKIDITCTNRDLPIKLPFGSIYDNKDKSDFKIEKSGSMVDRIICLIKPTPSITPFKTDDLKWRLISQLSLNYLSLVDKDSLKEILKLYNFDDTPSKIQQIEGIYDITYDKKTIKIKDYYHRGIEVTIVIDESKFVGSSYYLLASVLENFFGQYISINSFSQTVLKTIQQKKVIKKWKPRNGNRILL